MPAPTRPVTAHVALGSNLGDRGANLLEALDRLGASPDLRVITVSSFFDNPAVGGPQDSPPFLNAAAVVETMLSPQELLGRLLDVERQMGRRRRLKWEPRVIDLDLLLYGMEVVDAPDLKVPHPLLHARAFVLKPLAEIAHAAIHPVLGRTVGDLLLILEEGRDASWPPPVSGPRGFPLD